MKKCARDQAQRALESGRDEYLFVGTENSARDGKVGSDRGAQGRVSDGIWRTHGTWRQNASAPGGEAGPQLAGKGIQGRQTHLKRCDRGLRRSRLDARAVRGIGWVAGESGSHNGSRGPLAQNVAFAGKKAVGQIDGSARGGKLAGEAAGGGKPFARVQNSMGNGVAKALINLPVERRLALAIEFQTDQLGRVA